MMRIALIVLLICTVGAIEAVHNEIGPQCDCSFDSMDALSLFQAKAKTVMEAERELLQAREQIAQLRKERDDLKAEREEHEHHQAREEIAQLRKERDNLQAERDEVKAIHSKCSEEVMRLKEAMGILQKDEDRENVIHEVDGNSLKRHPAIIQKKALTKAEEYYCHNQELPLTEVYDFTLPFVLTMTVNTAEAQTGSGGVLEARSANARVELTWDGDAYSLQLCQPGSWEECMVQKDSSGPASKGVSYPIEISWDGSVARWTFDGVPQGEWPVSDGFGSDTPTLCHTNSGGVGGWSGTIHDLKFTQAQAQEPTFHPCEDFLTSSACPSRCAMKCVDA